MSNKSTTHLSSKLVITKPPIKVFYKIFEEENESTGEKFTEIMLNGSQDVVDRYENLLKLFQELKCPELEEGCFKLTKPYSKIEPILNQYGYNMIETQIEM